MAGGSDTVLQADPLLPAETTTTMPAARVFSTAMSNVTRWIL